MLHLFSGVVLHPDIMVGTSSREYVISDFTDYPEFESKLDSIDVLLSDEGYTNLRVSSYDELVGKKALFKTDLDFFQDVFNHAPEKCGVYADVKTYALLAIKYIKLVHTSITPELAYTIYKLSLDKAFTYTVYATRKYRGFNILSRQELFGYRAVKQLSKDEFIKLYSETAFTYPTVAKLKAFREAIRQKLSTEYQIINAMNGDESFNETLEYELKNIILYYMIGIINTVSNTLFYDIFNLETVNNSFVEEAEKRPLINKMLPIFDYNKETDFDFYRELLAKTIPTFNRLHGERFDRNGSHPEGVTSRENFCEDMIYMVAKETTVQQLIERVLANNSKHWQTVVFINHKEDHLNGFALGWIFDLIKANDTETLDKLMIYR